MENAKPEPAPDNTNIGKTMKMESDSSSDIKTENEDSCSLGGKPVPGLKNIKQENGTSDVKVEIKNEIKTEPSTDGVKQEIKTEVKKEDGSGDGAPPSVKSEASNNLNTSRSSDAGESSAKPRVKKSKFIVILNSSLIMLFVKG